MTTARYSPRSRSDLMELTQDGTLTKDAITGGGEQFLGEDLKDRSRLHLEEGGSVQVTTA